MMCVASVAVTGRPPSAKRCRALDNRPCLRLDCLKRSTAIYSSHMNRSDKSLASTVPQNLYIKQFLNPVYTV